MSRRVSLPGAEELFRQTSAGEAGTSDGSTASELSSRANRRGSGRVKHDEKMTVYVTADELLEVEQARLALRRHLGQAVDRGRLVREALALALADLEERGPDSDLARRLLGK